MPKPSRSHATTASSEAPSANLLSPASEADRGTRIPVLYLAPWIDFGGADKGTIDWFRLLDRDRFKASLITTQPSDNRRLHEVYPFAEEVWCLPDHFRGEQYPRFIFDFIHTRGIRLLHIMNSRLAFELLPDLATLEHPPRVVVQLHVEEADRSGYVRYVASRYGNLVDAFSVSSHHLAEALRAYEVAASRIHVIPTGVDALEEFNPDLVEPVQPARVPGDVRILFAGRLVEQKDPLLMVEVAARVMSRHENVRVDVLGDGPLAPAVLERARQLGLDARFRIHPPAERLATWLRSSDLLLMTSVFEGVPYVVYEAMAMGVPVVPSLPGNAELVAGGGGVLVEPRDDPDAYAAALAELVRDGESRRRLGEIARRRMLESFSLRDTIADHEALYETLVDPPAPQPPPPPVLGPLRLGDRPPSGTPLVSIVTPCFEHGRYLPSFFEGMASQDYPAVEVIIADDGSTDAETLEALDEIEASGRARVLRQDGNRGPSSARNRAIAAAQGRYILPVDADNVLVAGAVSRLVSQLQAAGERVGFIYPTFQHFGTRDYRFDAPLYNLFSLLYGNFVDTGSLFDRSIFDAGIRFPEDIKLGHEDWDLALALAARQVYGEPSREVVMRHRNQGFTRSGLVEYLRLPFWLEVRQRHPELFGAPEDAGMWGRHRGPAARIKAEWNPALTIILSDPVDFGGDEGRALERMLVRQSCQDFELIAECPRTPLGSGLALRRLPPGLASSPVERLQDALDVSRGRYLLVSSSPADLLADRTTVEKLARGFAMHPELNAAAFLTSESGRYPFQPLDRVPSSARPHSLAWRRELHTELDSLGPVDAHYVPQLALALHRCCGRMQWRHFPATAPDPPVDAGARPLALERRDGYAKQPAVQLERQQRLKVMPALPAIPHDQVVRWTLSTAWMPPETLPLVRHIEIEGSRRIITNDRTPPAGFRIEFDLGSIQRYSPPGTTRLVRRGARFLTLPRGSERDPEDEELGHLEEVGLPLFTGIERIILADGSESLVVADQRDPLRGQSQDRTRLGFIEAYPNEPIGTAPFSALLELVLLRFADERVRRHRYAVVTPGSELTGEGQLAGELGVLLGRPEPATVALQMDADGWVFTEEAMPERPNPRSIDLARWTFAPLGWHGFRARGVLNRAVRRRAVDSLQITSRRLPARRDGDHRVLGYLYRAPGPGRAELFSAVHPVLPDQFLTHHAIEATDMGYRNVQSLGYIRTDAPITGTLGTVRRGADWTSRLGLAARTGWSPTGQGSGQSAVSDSASDGSGVVGRPRT